jgi:hypothetical protein
MGAQADISEVRIMSTQTDAAMLREMVVFHSIGETGAALLQRIASQFESDAKRQAESEKLQEIGRTAYGCVADMVAALECDYDRLYELRDERKAWLDENPGRYLDPNDPRAAAGAHWALEFPDESDELAELSHAAGECESREDAEQRIREHPLSVELSGTWALGSEPVADRAYILLGTGGPATRIVCELDENGEATRAWIQAQDWGTPWTDYVGGDGEVLLTYCQQFCFIEG